MNTHHREPTFTRNREEPIYREDDGSLVVIDYKTDAVPAGALPVRAAYYRPQLQAYVDMLRAATGVADIRPVLLFLHPKSDAVGTLPVGPACPVVKTGNAR